MHSAMPSVTAKRKCPDLIFVPPRFEVYRQVSQQIREIFAEYQATRSQTVLGVVSDVDQMLEIAETLLASVFPFRRPVRLLGVTLTSLNTEESGQEPQLDLGL